MPETLERGFREVINAGWKPVAISFAFPVRPTIPTESSAVICLTSLLSGMGLPRSFLEDKFGIPVFINNDADLFAYGEALAGALPEINSKLERLNSAKRYKNLLGYTGEPDSDSDLPSTDKCTSEITLVWRLSAWEIKKYPDVICEDGVAIHALKREYAQKFRRYRSQPRTQRYVRYRRRDPEGNREAVLKTFEDYGEIAGDAMATAATLIDGLIVIGGGITAARKYIMPALLKRNEGQLQRMNGETISRLQFKVYDWMISMNSSNLPKGGPANWKIYRTDKSVVTTLWNASVSPSQNWCQPCHLTRAYAFALQQIDRQGWKSWELKELLILSCWVAGVTELLSCWVAELLSCWVAELLSYWVERDTGVEKELMND